ncbi:MAG: PID-CTERM protein-sorting domain-containing protein [Janthinobacterium lividum]
MTRLFFISSLFFSILASHAQAPATGGPTQQAPAAVPLDGGAGLLLASGVAYGLKRLRRKPQS